MNQTENKSKKITDADMKAITTALDTISAILPFIWLDDKKAQKLTHIDAYKKVFVKDAITQIDFGEHILPAYVSKDDIQDNMALFEQTEAIESKLHSLLRRITDTKMVTGNTLYLSGLAVLRYFEIANSAGIPGAKAPYDKLKKRFDSQSNAVVYAPKKL